MSTKSGQRCTAIRRALVPASSFSAVRRGGIRQLAQIKVGNPRNEEVRMGSLVSRNNTTMCRPACASSRAKQERCMTAQPSAGRRRSGDSRLRVATLFAYRMRIRPRWCMITKCSGRYPRCSAIEIPAMRWHSPIAARLAVASPSALTTAWLAGTAQALAHRTGACIP